MLPPVPFSISISGPDTSGLLVRITDALEALSCHLADARIAQLVGRVSGILVVYGPEGTTQDDLSNAFAPVRAAGLRVEVLDAPDDGWPSYKTPFSQPYMISYEGADCPEMLTDLAKTLTAAGCHFSDISLDSTLGDESNVYVLVCEVEAPLELNEMQVLTDKVGKAHGRELSVMAANFDELDI